MPIQRRPDEDDLPAVRPTGHHGTGNGYAARSPARAQNRVVDAPADPVVPPRPADRSRAVFVRTCTCSMI